MLPSLLPLIFCFYFFICLGADSVNAALPPGYEDEMWCPPGFCDRRIRHVGGFVGPASSFHECFHRETGQVVEAVWTGNLTNVAAPEDWISGPDLVPCGADTTTAETETTPEAAIIHDGTSASVSVFVLGWRTVSFLTTLGVLICKLLK
mmetsp:Transcript_17132/g.27786  ORF Transcript_17132/g.27786 Transcript_17132/m.27786 type:complete len:149 (+) Transcript_17132:34-480(+)